MVQNQWEAERQLPAEASIFAAQTSTQLNVRIVEYDTSAEKDEFNRIQMQEFAIQAEEAFDAQRQIFAQEAGEEVRRRGNVSCTSVNYLYNKLNSQSLEFFIHGSALRQSHAMPNWSAGITSKSTINSLASLLQKGIACKIANFSGVRSTETRTSASTNSDRHTEGL